MRHSNLGVHNFYEFDIGEVNKIKYTKLKKWDRAHLKNKILEILDAECFFNVYF